MLFIGIVAAFVNFAGRAGFPRHRETFDGRIDTGAALGDHRFHDISYPQGGLLRYGPANELRFKRFDGFAMPVCDGLYDIGSHENPVIGDGRNRPYQLQDRNRDAVSKRNGARVNMRPLAVMTHAAGGFTGAVDTGFFTEPEMSKCLVKLSGTDFFTDLDGPDIA